jgi:predicted DNA-binding antitoxin AbrB/MazE fold protein
MKHEENQGYTFSAMSKTIEAIYENGMFRPITPVNLPEGTRVFIDAETIQTDAEAQIREQLLADGANSEEFEKIIDNFRQLWSYDTLTEEQKESLERARLDQEIFFAGHS